MYNLNYMDTTVNVIDDVRTRMSTSGNVKFGKTNLDTVSNPNFEDAILTPGDVIQFRSGDDYKNDCFEQTLGSNKAYGVVGEVISGEDAGTAKSVYFSSLKKSVRVVDATGAPVLNADGSRKTVNAGKDNALFMAAKSAPVVGRIAAMLEGKKVRVTEVPGSPCLRATYDENRKVNGSQETHVYAFEVVE